MKKILLFIASLFILTSCMEETVDNNPGIYKKVHIFKTQQCYPIKRFYFYKYSNIVGVNIDGYGKCSFDSDQIVLIEDKCPFCDVEKEDTKV